MTNQSKPQKVTLTIVSQKGTCQMAHKVGQQFDVSESTPAGLCQSAYHSAYPSIMAMRYGAKLPWQEPDSSVRVACPDPYNPVVMEIKVETK